MLSIPTRALLNDVVTLRKREFANALFSALQSCGRCIGLAIAAFPVEELPLIDTFRTHLRASFVLAVVFILSLNLSAVFFVNEPCARGQIPVAGVLEDGDEMNDERKNERRSIQTPIADKKRSSSTCRCQQDPVAMVNLSQTKKSIPINCLFFATI